MTTSQDTREQDRYGRTIYASAEIPPATEGFALWRGKITHPDAVCNQQSAERLHGERKCRGGWIESGEWWLHCPICRPERVMPDLPTGEDG